MKNEVNEKTIKENIKSKVLFYEMSVFAVFFIGIVAIAFLVNPLSREKAAALWTFPLFGAFVIIHVVGRYTNFLRKKACIDWYQWDMKRIEFFEQRKQEISDSYEIFLNKSVSEAVLKNPQDVEEQKKVALEMLADLKKHFDSQRDIIMRELNSSDVEIVKLLQVKSKIDESEERLEESVVDFFARIYREEQEPELLRNRLEISLRKQTISQLHEKLSWYDELIASCQSSTEALTLILRKDYEHIVS